MATIEIEVKGMTCGHCERAVEEGVSALAGVEAVRADRERGRVVIETTVGATVTEDALREILEDEGYSFGGVVA